MKENKNVDVNNEKDNITTPDSLVREEETLDDLQLKGIRIIQKKKPSDLE